MDTWEIHLKLWTERGKSITHRKTLWPLKKVHLALLVSKFSVKYISIVHVYC